MKALHLYRLGMVASWFILAIMLYSFSQSCLPKTSNSLSNTPQADPQLSQDRSQYLYINNRNIKDSPTPYSNFKVFGGSFNDPTSRLLWHFKNVCYDAKTNRFNYYSDPNKLFQDPILFHNGTHYKFPKLLAGKLMDQEFTIDIVTMNSEIPNQSKYWENKVVVWLIDIWSSNWGHLMMDHMYPTFHATQLLQLFDPNEIRLVITNSRTNKIASTKKWLNDYGITKGDASQAVRELQQNGITCFHNLVIGAQNFAFFAGTYGENSGRGLTYTMFSNFLRYKIGGLTPDDRAKEQRILIVYKDGKDWAGGRRNFLDVPAMVSALESAFPTIPVETSTVFFMTPHEQIKYLSRFTVIITPAGSVSMSSLLFADGTCGIFPDYWNLDEKKSAGLEQYLYQNYPWMINYQYTLGSPVEVKHPPMDKPLAGYRPVYGTFQSFNLKYYGSPIIDTTKLAKLVYSALYRVYEDRGKDFAFVTSLDL